VLEAVTRQFVTGVDDPPDQGRVAFGNPAQSEKRCPDTGAPENLKHPVRVALHAGLEAIPVFPADPVGECLNLESANA